MPYTITDAQARLELYLAAEVAVLKGQSYKIGDRELRRADLAEIRSGIKECQEGIAAFSPVRRFSRIIRPGF